MLIAGTVLVKDMPLTIGEVKADRELLMVNGYRIPCAQGTGAMVSAALATTEHLGLEPPHVLLAGDTGRGSGSRDIYEYLIENVVGLSPTVLALHYCLPDMALTGKLCEAVARCARRPVMIADAASMYAAKAAGLAREFDIFTPDSSEIAFLADPDATHPAYIARHLFDTAVADIPKLVSAAYKCKGATRLLLVKGATDYIVHDGKIIETISEPDVPALEAIGGTGDTITGMVSAFASAELEPHEAAILAARANRMAGKYAEPTPATRVGVVVRQLPAVYRNHLCHWSGVCYSEGVQQ
ncbi:MAG TPA: sugar kinase [Dehalococcoidia bacterium]|nr:sugar kinase [Dehalococcoidia bacterium]